MDLIKYQEGLAPQIQTALAGFTAIEPKLKAGTFALPVKVETKEDRDALYKAASEAQKLVKSYADARLDLTRPIDDLKKAVMAHEKEQVAELETAISSAKALILAYDQEQERIRQAELARLEAERKAREEAERKERQRVEDLRRNFENWKLEQETKINRASIAELEALKEVTMPEFQELRFQAIQFAGNLLNVAAERLAYLREQARLQAEAEAAALANREEAARLAEMQRKQAEERAELEAEQRRIQEEARKAAEMQERLRAELAAAETERARREEEDRLRKELEDARIKGITQGVESFEITDLCLVPPHLLRIDLNIPELKKYLKDNETVPGLVLKFKNNITLR